MAGKVKCPLSPGMGWCKKEECALWDKDADYQGSTGTCIWNKLARDLGEIRDHLAEIKEKLQTVK